MQIRDPVAGHVITFFKMADNKIKTKVILFLHVHEDEVIVLFYKKLNQLNMLAL